MMAVGRAHLILPVVTPTKHHFLVCPKVSMIMDHIPISLHGYFIDENEFQECDTLTLSSFILNLWFV